LKKWWDYFFATWTKIHISLLPNIFSSSRTR
jgi:hypothetical protein